MSVTSNISVIVFFTIGVLTIEARGQSSTIPNRLGTYQPIVFQESEGAEEGGEELEFESEFEDPFEERIETERHDFTQSATTVGCGVMQFEYGVLYLHKAEGAERENTYSTPELLFRYGLTEKWEFRTKFNYAYKQNNEEDELSGIQDLRFATKYRVSEQCCYKPTSAVEFRLSVPTGNSEISSGRVEPGLDYIYTWELNEYFNFSGSTGVNKNGLNDVGFFTPVTDPTDHFFAWTQSFALGAELTENTTGYFEWFGVYTDGREEELAASFLNFGVDYYLSHDVVIDARIGWGLTDDSDDLFVGFGGGFRF